MGIVVGMINKRKQSKSRNGKDFEYITFIEDRKNTWYMDFNGRIEDSGAEEGSRVRIETAGRAGTLIEKIEIVPEEVQTTIAAAKPDLLENHKERLEQDLHRGRITRLAFIEAAASAFSLDCMASDEDVQKAAKQIIRLADHLECQDLENKVLLSSLWPREAKGAV